MRVSHDPSMADVIVGRSDNLKLEPLRDPINKIGGLASLIGHSRLIPLAMSSMIAHNYVTRFRQLSRHARSRGTLPHGQSRQRSNSGTISRGNLRTTPPLTWDLNATTSTKNGASCSLKFSETFSRAQTEANRNALRSLFAAAMTISVSFRNACETLFHGVRPVRAATMMRIRRSLLLCALSCGVCTAAL